MKINLNDPENDVKLKDLAKALAVLGRIDPEGKLMDAMAGVKLPKADEDMTKEDRERIANAEAKRKRRALRNLKRD